MKKFLVLALLMATALISPANAQLDLFDTKTVVNISYKSTDKDNGLVIVRLKDGWHINANPASLPSLIPTEVKLISKDERSIINVLYPQSHQLSTPLGDIAVYSGSFNIPIKLKVSGKNEVEKLQVTAQACDIGTCYPPATWDFPIAGK